jgi:thiamine biosynthesis protein ThiS
MIEITLNGECHKVEAGSVREVLERLSRVSESLLVEHNGEALHRREWAERLVREGDRLELLRIVAGG